MAQLLPSPLSCPPFIHSFIHSFPTYFLHAFSLPSAQPWRNTAPPPTALTTLCRSCPRRGWSRPEHKPALTSLPTSLPLGNHVSQQGYNCFVFEIPLIFSCLCIHDSSLNIKGNRRTFLLLNILYSGWLVIIHGSSDRLHSVQVPKITKGNSANYSLIEITVLPIPD